jgi:carboxypeptidase Taq
MFASALALQAYKDLKLRLEKIHDLDRVRAILQWDAWTMMPPKGAEVRAEQIATLERVYHERLTSPDIGRRLEELRPYEETLDPQSDEASLLRITRYDYEKAARVPAGLRAQIARAASLAEHVWEQARARSNFTFFLPHLEEVVALKRRYIECFDDAEHPYDPLLDDFEPGLTTAEVDRVLGQLKAALLPLAAAIADRVELVDDSCLFGRFPIARQRQLVHGILRQLPFDSASWRVDEAAHPFSTGFCSTDIRITTHYRESFIAPGIFSALHEFGHGLYDGGIDPALERTALAHPSSLGMHESQSRMWENLIGRSREFWTRFYPAVASAFPEQFEKVEMEEFYRAVNKVQPSRIRIDADEVTYNLHVILRYELERQIFEDKLALRDLPEAWGALTKEYLGVDIRNDAEGVLQDVHWSEGLFGYFPTYALGNILSAQFWNAVRADIPGVGGQIGEGEFAPVREWLREKIHHHGRKLTASEAVEALTGGPINPEPYVTYLKRKMGSIYGLDLSTT